MAFQICVGPHYLRLLAACFSTSRCVCLGDYEPPHVQAVPRPAKCVDLSLFNPAPWSDARLFPDFLSVNNTAVNTCSRLYALYPPNTQREAPFSDHVVWVELPALPAPDVGEAGLTHHPGQRLGRGCRVAWAEPAEPLGRGPPLLLELASHGGHLWATLEGEPLQRETGVGGTVARRLIWAPGSAGPKSWSPYLCPLHQPWVYLLV